MKSHERYILKTALEKLKIPYARFTTKDDDYVLLAEGYQWPDGSHNEVNIYYRSREESREVCEAIIADLSERGFNAEMIDSYTVKLHRKIISDKEANSVIRNMAKGMGLV